MQENISYLKVALAGDISQLTLNEYIGNGQTAVIVVVDPSGSNIDIGAFAVQRYYTASQYAVYNAYSDTNDLNQIFVLVIIKQQVEEDIFRIQLRIAKATKALRWNKVWVLQRLLTRSHQAKLLAVRRVTSNRGRNTPGINGTLWINP